MSTASRRRLSIAEMLRNELEVETGGSSLSDIFDEEPPPLEVFVSDKRYLDQRGVTLGALQYDFIRHFEQILFPETYILMVEEFGAYWTPVRFCNEYSAEWGKGGGKDYVCQLSFSRLANILLSLKNPQEYYDLGPDTILHMLNVAATAPQAHGVFFKPMRSMLTRSPWFSDKFEGDLPSPQAGEVRFKKQIELISGHSQADNLEGKNLIAGVADEIAAFKTEQDVQVSKTGVAQNTAKAIVNMLKTSSSSRFPETYRVAQISFPRYKGDAIEQAIAKGSADNSLKGETSRHYVSGPHATWVVNPRYDRFERIEVPGATQPVPNVPLFVEDYADDPAEARAKYECKPELAQKRFLNNDEVILAAFSEVPAVPPITVEYYWGVDDSGDPADNYTLTKPVEVPGWQVRFHFAPDFRPLMGANYTLHGDMAITGDRAGVAMTHVRAWDRRDWAVAGSPEPKMESRPIVRMDFVTAFEADSRATPAPREVQIRWYRKLIWELKTRGFNIAGVSFDNFQSADSLQILTSWGIETRKASTDRTSDLYDSFKDLLYDGRLEGYYVPVLVGELQRLTKLRNGKIDHPPGGSKDLADALAGAAAYSVEVGGDEGEAVAYADEGGWELYDSAPGQGNPMGLDFGMVSLGMSGGGLGSIQW